MSRSFGLALLLLTAACGADPAAPRAAAAPRVVLITVDTLRADALGCYGADGAATPAIDRLATQSVLFERAYSQATITHPALSSMLTGLLPVRHGVSGQAARMHDGVLSVAALAQAAGVPTASFVANLCKLQEQPHTVFHDGWDHRFCGMDVGPEQYEWDAAVVSAAIEWIADQSGAFFAWVHLMDPHAEHRPPPDLWDYDARPVPSKEEQYHAFGAFEEARTFPPEDLQQDLLELYAAEVTGADRQVGRLLAALDTHPAADEIALVFSADHGEELFETWSRYDHGLSMTEGVLWVPLLVRAPELAPRRVTDPVEILAIGPTLLELLGVRAPYELDGASLFAASERDFALSFAADISVSLRTRDERYWLRRTEEPYERPADQFPWRADAPWFKERECFARYGDDTATEVVWQDLADPASSERAAELRARLEEFAKAAGSRSTRLDSPELLEQLRELGYVDGEL